MALPASVTLVFGFAGADLRLMAMRANQLDQGARRGGDEIDSHDVSLAFLTAFRKLLKVGG